MIWIILNCFLFNFLFDWLLNFFRNRLLNFLDSRLCYSCVNWVDHFGRYWRVDTVLDWFDYLGSYRLSFLCSWRLWALRYIDPIWVEVNTLDILNIFRWLLTQFIHFFLSKLFYWLAVLEFLLCNYRAVTNVTLSCWLDTLSVQMKFVCIEFCRLGARACFEDGGIAKRLYFFLRGRNCCGALISVENRGDFISWHCKFSRLFRGLSLDNFAFYLNHFSLLETWKSQTVIRLFFCWKSLGHFCNRGLFATNWFVIYRSSPCGRLHLSWEIHYSLGILFADMILLLWSLRYALRWGLRLLKRACRTWPARKLSQRLFSLWNNCCPPLLVCICVISLFYILLSLYDSLNLFLC